ncbi:hypothetical protein RIMD111065_03110 [Aeromonas hydrophila]|nr:hypothetical protein [Aeromonas hydrophila]BCO11955.1 hypothetical protein RIMD111065_03110 [Aeromonas hydrophila]
MSGLGAVFAHAGNTSAQSSSNHPYPTRHLTPDSPAIPVPTLLFGRLRGH